MLVSIELLIPAWAERAARTTFHAEHIAQRYGVFMTIVLGESALAASLAIQGVLRASGFIFELVAVVVGSLLIVYSMCDSHSTGRRSTCSTPCPRRSPGATSAHRVWRP